MVSALVAIIYSCSHVSLAKQCEKWEAKDYRDCTCGIQYKDNETNCENSNTYLDPVLDQSDLICPFKCENDGDLYVLGENHYYCNCKPGFAGVCCEMGKEGNQSLASELHNHSIFHSMLMQRLCTVVECCLLHKEE